MRTVYELRPDTWQRRKRPKVPAQCMFHGSGGLSQRAWDATRGLNWRRKKEQWGVVGGLRPEA